MLHAKSPLVVLAAALMLSAAAETLPAAQKEVVSYRLKEWKTVEFEDAKKAKTHYDTIKKLGCEVKQNEHAGHIDVTYRCPEWKQIALKSHSDAHKWEKWLKASGFETKHAH